MQNAPASVKVAVTLLFFIAFIWLCFGLLVLGNVITTVPAGPIRLIMGLLALCCSIALTLVTASLIGHNRLAYIGMVSLLVLIIIASFLDDIGLLDVILIAIDLATLGLLIKDRAWYLHQNNSGEKP